MAKREAGVTYSEADAGYFERRGLRRHAGAWSLWALGVGAVISGDFFGWNFGLKAGGFGGLAIATGIVAVLYIGLSYSIAEMSPALPHTGGAYSFGRTALGPWGGYVTGLAENMEYVLTPAVIVVGIAGYMSTVFDSLFGWTPPSWAWWAIFYTLFVGLNVWGVAASFRFTVVITFLALAILVVFWIGAIPHFDLSRHALDIGPGGERLPDGGGPWLPMGWAGVARAIPFAIWFYLAIEQLPLAAEEAHDPVRDVPRGMLWGILTLIVASVLTLVLSAGIAPGAYEVGRSNDPLFLGFRTIFGDGAGAAVLSLVAVAGLVASFHAIIYAYGRNIYSLSRAGYFPRWLSVTHSTRRTPHVALIVGAVLGYLVCIAIEYSKALFGDETRVGAVLLNMAVFGAVIAYVLQMISYLIIRRMPIDRPYVSPLGDVGAVLALVISLGALVCLFLDDEYRPGVYGCAAWFAAGLFYFLVYARHRMILSPEEEFAVEHRVTSRGENA